MTHINKRSMYICVRTYIQYCYDIYIYIALIYIYILYGERERERVSEKLYVSECVCVYVLIWLCNEIFA